MVLIGGYAIIHSVADPRVSTLSVQREVFGRSRGFSACNDWIHISGLRNVNRNRSIFLHRNDDDVLSDSSIF